MINDHDTLSTQMMLLTKSQSYLTRMKVKDPLIQRFEKTWHRSTLRSNWASTIGMWGGVATPEAIMARARANYTTFKMFRQRNALITERNKSSLRPQHDLAIAVQLRWVADQGKGVTTENILRVSSHFGILPIEMRVYLDRMAMVQAELDMADPSELFGRVAAEAVAAAWTAHSEDIDLIVAASYSHMSDDE